MTNTLEINKGEGVSALMTWTDDDGVPINLSGATCEIFEAFPASLKGGTVTLEDPTQGTATMRIPQALIAALGTGRTAWVRVAVTPDNGMRDVTPQIWLNIV